MKPEISAFAVNSYSYIFSHTGIDFVTEWQERGHSVFELMIYPGHLWPADLDSAARFSIKRHLRARDCRVETLNLPNLDLNIGAANPAARALSLDLIEETLKLAADLEAGAVLIGPGKPNPLFPMPHEQMIDYLFAALDRLLPLARRLGVGVALENLPIAFLPTASSMMTALDRYGESDIGIVYDVANAHFVGEDPVEGLRAAEPRLRLVHVSDTTRRVYRHDPIGQGDVPFAAIGTSLSEGTPILTMLEIISDTPDRDILESAKKLASLTWPLPAAGRRI